MASEKEFEQLKTDVGSGEISNASKTQLEKYVFALCSRQAYNALGDKEFWQIAETVRLLLFKKYTEAIDKKNTCLQCIVIALMVLTIIVGGIQIYVALSAKQSIISTLPKTPEIMSPPITSQSPKVAK